MPNPPLLEFFVYFVVFSQTFSSLSIIVRHVVFSEDEEETQYDMVQGEFLALNGGEAPKKIIQNHLKLLLLSL